MGKCSKWPERFLSIVTQLRLCLRIAPAKINVLWSSVSNLGFPEHETRVFWQFSTTRNPLFFQLPFPDISKNLELLLYSNICNSDNTEVSDLIAGVWRPN